MTVSKTFREAQYFAAYLIHILSTCPPLIGRHEDLEQVEILEWKIEPWGFDSGSGSLACLRIYPQESA